MKIVKVTIFCTKFLQTYILYMLIKCVEFMWLKTDKDFKGMRLFNKKSE